MFNLRDNDKEIFNKIEDLIKDIKSMDDLEENTLVIMINDDSFIISNY